VEGGGGARWLSADGSPDPDRAIYTWITTRMVHVYSLGALRGFPGAASIAAQALAGLTGSLRDDKHGGWFNAVGADGDGLGTDKWCYDHGFVVLAAASAVHAEILGASPLLDEAIAIYHDRFWDDEVGRFVDTWDRSFTELDPYRGLNANMHGVETLLSVASLTGDPVWLERSARICDFVIDQGANNNWRLPEHFDADWNPILDYNIDKPADQFKPYGATVGHAFEWSRLLVHQANSPSPVIAVERLVEAAVSLFHQAVVDGWACDGADGFVYTTDWDGRPVVRDRLWWVLNEAIAAAAILWQQTGDAVYARHYRQWWDYAADHYIDPADGSWRHQLAPDNQPADSVWAGKPDLYHAFQCALVPTLPRYPMIAAALDQAGAA
jgi:mannose/cellobiose epimerase-like protein (N-acyl-D-glucosamine 2-epimerase family)